MKVQNLKVTFDKIRETRYHYDNLRILYKQIECENDIFKLVRFIRAFRYEINSFVNSHRATTLTLQKECRNKYGEKFNEWYATALEELINDEFSIIIKELRNINQKEGNIFPTFIFEAEKNGKKIYWEGDLHNSKWKSFNIANISGYDKKVSDKNIIKEDIIGSPEFMTANKFTELDVSIFLEGLANFTNKILDEFDKNSKISLHKIVIDRFDKAYEPDEFMDNLFRVAHKLESLCKKADSEL